MPVALDDRGSVPEELGDPHLTSLNLAGSGLSRVSGFGPLSRTSPAGEG
jgi:hypothetical protein